MSQEKMSLPALPKGYENPNFVTIYTAAMMQAYARQAVQEVLARQASTPVDATRVASQILSYLGFAQDESAHPGADRRRDTVALMIEQSDVATQASSIAQLLSPELQTKHATCTDHGTQQQDLQETETISKFQWIHEAMRVYRIAGDTEEEALELATHLWNEADKDDLGEPMEAALEDVEGRKPVDVQFSGSTTG